MSKATAEDSPERFLHASKDELSGRDGDLLSPVKMEINVNDSQSEVGGVCSLAGGDQRQQLLQKVGLSFTDSDDCDHDGGNQPRQSSIGGAMASTKTEFDAPIAEDRRRYEGLDTCSSSDEASVRRGEEGLGDSSSKARTSIETEQADDGDRRSTGGGVSLRPSRDGTKEDPMGRSNPRRSPRSARTPAGCLQQRSDPQARERLDESTSVSDNVDSSSASGLGLGEHSDANRSREGAPQDSREGGLGLDLGLVIAAVSAMVAMSVPDKFRRILWTLCCATVVYVPAQRWGLTKRAARGSVSSTEGGGVADDQVARSDVPGVAAAVVVVAAFEQRSSLGTEAAATHPEKVIEASEREATADILGDGVTATADGDVREAGVSAGAENEVGARVGTMGGGFHEEIEAGLSAVQLAFLSSAGEEQKRRLLLQCLEYANGDVTQAKRVCTAFCDFRLEEGWSMVLSASELRDPLRSRVHTLTERRDSLGRAMMTFSPGALDITKAPAVAYHKMLCYVLQEVLEEPDVPEKGIVLLVDARGVGAWTLRHFKMADYRRGLRMLSGAFPVKVKAVRILHPNRALSLALSTASALMSSKMRDRLEIVPGDQAADGSFARKLADPSAVPVELEIGGAWTGSQEYWDKWVAHRVSRT